jgi:hypothetical protein
MLGFNKIEIRQNCPIAKIKVKGHLNTIVKRHLLFMAPLVHSYSFDGVNVSS